MRRNHGPHIPARCKYLLQLCKCFTSRLATLRVRGEEKLLFLVHCNFTPPPPPKPLNGSTVKGSFSSIVQPAAFDQIHATASETVYVRTAQSVADKSVWMRCRGSLSSAEEHATGIDRPQKHSYHKDTNHPKRDIMCICLIRFAPWQFFL